MPVYDLRFDVASFSADAIQRAAYRFGDRLSIELIESERVYLCQVHLPITDSIEAEAIVADFRNEVLDQVLRERIRTETEGVRNVVLSLAFSNTPLVSEN